MQHDCYTLVGGRKYVRRLCRGALPGLLLVPVMCCSWAGLQLGARTQLRDIDGEHNIMYQKGLFRPSDARAG